MTAGGTTKRANQPDLPNSAKRAKAKTGERAVGSPISIAPARVGAPQLYDRREVMQAIGERIAGGESLTAICKEPEMPSRFTVLGWVGDDPDIATIYRCALGMRADQYAEEIVSLADTALGKSNEDVQAIKLMVNSRQWVASRLLPKLYGDHQVIDHTGQGQIVPEQVDQRLALLIRKMQAIEVKP